MFFGGIKKIKSFCYMGLVLVALFLFLNTAKTETESGNINVNMTVPSLNHCNNGVQDGDEDGVDCGGAMCGSCDGGGQHSPQPYIYDISSVVYLTSAKVFWKVNDFGEGISLNSLEYSEDLLLNKTTVTITSNTEFFAIVSDLKPDTVYNFVIKVKNNSAVEAVPYYGQFKTQKGNVLNSLTILAKPEKRVAKTGGNYGATANILFYDSVANSIVFNTTTVLDSSGSTVLNNVEIPATVNMSVILKTNAHLAKRINGVNTETTDLTLDFTVNNTFELLAGEIMGSLKESMNQNPFYFFLKSASRDDVVDALDISRLLTAVKIQSTEEAIDLNRDNIVDSLDISIFDINKEKKGDIAIR